MNTNTPQNHRSSLFETPSPPAANEPCEIKLGFEIDGMIIGYRTYTLNWAVLARGLNDIDPEVIRDEQARAAFTFWRDAVRSSVVSSFAQSWMDKAEWDNLEKDIEQYLLTTNNIY